jgi:hypothetical protein
MKRYNPKDKPTKPELEYMGKVAQLLCCKCGVKPVQVNHWAETNRRKV